MWADLIPSRNPLLFEETKVMRHQGGRAKLRCGEPGSWCLSSPRSEQFPVILLGNWQDSRWLS